MLSISLLRLLVCAHIILSSSDIFISVALKSSFANSNTWVTAGSASTTCFIFFFFKNGSSFLSLHISSDFFYYILNIENKRLPSLKIQFCSSEECFVRAEINLARIKLQILQ